MRARALVLGCLLAACEKPAVDHPGDCLPLPGAMRTQLTADPRGGGLYWFEPVRRWDYEAQLSYYWKLVRYDLRTHHLETLYDHVEAPFYAFDDELLMIRADKDRRLVLASRGGKLQELLPDYLSPVDVERIDDDSLAVLADGDGARAVYTLDLARPRPHHLLDADTVLSSKDGVVYAWVGRDGVAVDVASGTRTEFTQRDKSMPLGDELIYVDGDELVAMSMRDGTTHPVIDERHPWKLVHQAGSVLARTRPAGGRSDAVLIEPGRVTPLPVVLGGTSILATARADDQLWALVGHDTAHFDGDLADTEAETEVCMLPAGGQVTFKTRTVPGRFAHAQRVIDEAIARVAPGAGYQILDTPGLATEVFVEVPEPGGDDLAAMRARVTQIAEHVTALLEDPEIMTEVRFADLRLAVYRWRRVRLGPRAWAGMGDVTLADPAGFDLELSDLVDQRRSDPDQIECEGTLANLHEEPLTDVEVRCILGDRSDVIHVPELGTGETYHFHETFDVDDDAEPLFEVYRKREPLTVHDRDAAARTRDLLAFATKIYRDTDLALISHEIKGKFEVALLARRGFDRRTPDERYQAVDRAYRAYDAGLRAHYDLPEDLTLSLTIDVEHSPTSYTYDGARLEQQDR